MYIAGNKVKSAALFTGLALACGASTSEVADTPTTEAQEEAPAAAETEDTEGVMADLGEAVELSLTFDGLEVLGDTHNYEAWVVVDEAPVLAASPDQ